MDKSREKTHKNLKKVVTSDMTADEAQLSSTLATRKGSRSDFWGENDGICCP